MKGVLMIAIIAMIAVALNLATKESDKNRYTGK